MRTHRPTSAENGAGFALELDRYELADLPLRGRNRVQRRMFATRGRARAEERAWAGVCGVRLAPTDRRS